MTTNTARTIAITAHIDTSWVERLKRLSPDLRIIAHAIRNDEAVFTAPASAPVADQLWHDAEVVYTFPNRLPLPEQAPQLRWVHLYSAGADNILEHPLFHTSVQFTTSSSVHAITIAEYVLTVTLAWFHRLPLLFQWQQQRLWPEQRERKLAPEVIQGKTVGIVGYGSIGRHVAQLARGCGMRVLAMQRGHDHRDKGFNFPGEGDPAGTLPERYYAPEDLHAMLKESDVVVIALPLTPKTQGLFDEAAFNAMKPGAFLINIARGGITDEAALLRALKEQRIAGAALDVFHQEPLPADNPLWELPNVILSPHVTGFTFQYNDRAAMIFEENLRRYLAGEPLFNLVDKEQGY
jgi:phosphoglycerate dehydrogenase-like enzyme